MPYMVFSSEGGSVPDRTYTLEEIVTQILEHELIEVDVSLLVNQLFVCSWKEAFPEPLTIGELTTLTPLYDRIAKFINTHGRVVEATKNVTNLDAMRRIKHTGEPGDVFTVEV